MLFSTQNLEVISFTCYLCVKYIFKDFILKALMTLKEENVTKTHVPTLINETLFCIYCLLSLSISLVYL